MDSKNLLLFSVDLEDFPVLRNGKEEWAGGIEKLVDRYLKFLDKFDSKATFFILGDVAEKYPHVIKKIVNDGHEVACHGYSHLPLNKHTPESFKADIQKALKTLKDAGANEVFGYRAPFLSLTPKTKWAYKILKELGFKYSSSVLPKYNPLFSWPGFGLKPQNQDGIWELPITVMPRLPIGIPAFSGVYYRVLPNWIIQRMVRHVMKGKKPIFSYFHPYDIDFDAVDRRCSWLKNNPIGNFFIFYNRESVLTRLEQMMKKEFQITTYHNYSQSLSVGTR